MDREINEQFSNIYDEYIEKIYRFVYLKVSSKEIAEDITSKVFLKGWKSYQTDSGKIKNIGAFLYQIAKNSIVDHYREADRTKIVPVEYVSNLSDLKTDIHEKAILNFEVENVKVALLNIKKDYQDIIIWHYLEDMPVSQIADMIKKPAGTVRVMLHRGLNSLKEELREQA